MAQELNKPKQEKPMPKRVKADILPSEKISAQEQKRLNDAFIEAVRLGNNTKMLRLLKAGADIDARDSWEGTALQLTATCNHPQTCALLIGEYKKAGRDIKALLDERDNWKRTPLHLAARLGNAGVCHVLITNGADPNATDCYNNTPLHEATIMKFQESCVRTAFVLLAAGADPDIRRNVDDRNVWGWVQGKEMRQYIYLFYQFRSIFPEDGSKAFGLNFLECVSGGS